jgi:hypothetical protein
MNGRASNDVPQQQLATVVRNLLEEKYGRGRVPGVRRISADIASKNNGETISHGQVFNILAGRANTLTDRTRMLLAAFFDKPPSYFYPVEGNDDPDVDRVQIVAARLASLDPAQIDAIRQAIDIVSAGKESIIPTNEPPAS